jgi:hypothetical protein
VLYKKWEKRDTIAEGRDLEVNLDIFLTEEEDPCAWTEKHLNA